MLQCLLRFRHLISCKHIDLMSLLMKYVANMAYRYMGPFHDSDHSASSNDEPYSHCLSQVAYLGMNVLTLKILI